MLPVLLYLVAVRANDGGATKCVDRIIDQEYKLHSQGLSTTMEWRSSNGNSCEDYEKLLLCDGTSTAGHDWTSFGADGLDASHACCACGHTAVVREGRRACEFLEPERISINTTHNPG